MSQDNLAKLECTKCKNINYYTRRNKKTLKERLVMKKYCKFCNKSVEHKEIK